MNRNKLLLEKIILSIVIYLILYGIMYGVPIVIRKIQTINTDSTSSVFIQEYRKVYKNCKQL